MQRLVYVLFQLDEARRYVEDGRLERLRLALLILDNAAELQLDRRTRDQLGHERMRAQTHRSFERLRELKPELEPFDDGWTPLSDGELARIERYFDEKLKYLVHRVSELDVGLADSLLYLHRYRNEAYHRGFVRRETIRTAALILLDINCELLISLPRAWTSMSSADNYSWLEERFGTVPNSFLDEGAVKAMVADIRDRVMPEGRDMAETLATHLEDRIDELYDSIDFIVDNTQISTREDAIRHAHWGLAVQQGRLPPAMDPPPDFRSPFSTQSIEALRNRATTLRGATSRIDAFRAFSQIERDLERIEEPIHDMAAEVDLWIQQQIDEMRGK